ncbi:MAG: DNA (cytosine-5-)-methyltransferase [Planctomycetaceae bacterium]
MPNLLIRDVPRAIHSQIRREHQRRLMSQNAYLVSLLSEAVERQNGPSLFDGIDDAALDVPNTTRNDVTYSVPFTFIDLFSGIGGMRLGLEAVGGKCLFSCEVDPHAQKTYRAWFGDNPAGNVTELTQKSDIPPHDVLAAGFPCQPFSLAGVSKKNSLGREHGFKDRTQGTLFFHLATIIEVHRPPVLLLENVKNLRSHNKGDTWKTIVGTLNDLDYEIFSEVIDASAWVPQHRERVLIVGFDRQTFGAEPPFQFPDPSDAPQPQLREILETSPDPKYTLSDQLWRYLQDYAERHRRKGNGFGCSIADPDGITRTLSARYHKDGSEVLISQGEKQNPRRLTPREAGRLMGFPEHLLDRMLKPPQVVSDTQAYKQFGNAVVPALIQAVARQIVKVMHWKVLRRNGCLLKR